MYSFGIIMDPIENINPKEDSTFSMILAASAVLKFDTLWTPAWIIFLYNLYTKFNAILLEPATTFLILGNVFFLSPGFILSGEYPQ